MALSLCLADRQIGGSEQPSLGNGTLQDTLAKVLAFCGLKASSSDLSLPWP
jgi:hypothetical protein